MDLLQRPLECARDRATLVQVADSRQRLWHPVRGPGGVLVDGEIVGTWRARTNRSRLEITGEPFGRLPRAARDAIGVEAKRIVPFRGCETVEVGYAG